MNLGATAAPMTGEQVKLVLEKVDTIIACINEAHCAKSEGWRSGCFYAADFALDSLKEMLLALASPQVATKDGAPDKEYL